MNCSTPRSVKDNQAGGITILLVLMLLVMFTVTIFGVSRNALRQSIITGTARQGAEVRNVADTGISWAVFWLDPKNVAGTGTSGASAFQTQVNYVLGQANLAGKYQAIPAGTSNADMIIRNTAGDFQSFDMSVMAMNKLPVAYTSQNAVPTNTPSEALYPDLWAVRADAHYVQGPVDFVHSKEAWVSTATRAVAGQ
jgi:hypothetical protein